MGWYLMVLRRYAVFRGRTGRTEYWMFYLISALIGIGVDIISALLHLGVLLGAVYGLGVLLPTLAVQVRRLHDTNRTGWWLLLYAFPLAYFGAAARTLAAAASGNTSDPWATLGTLLGSAVPCIISAIFLIVFWCQASDPSTNRFGPPPSAFVAGPSGSAPITIPEWPQPAPPQSPAATTPQPLTPEGPGTSTGDWWS